ncbi:MAG: hypothetical protein WAT79_14985 [Saprospiraceae bacterium]
MSRYPLPFQKLLEQCPNRIARVDQLKLWLEEYRDYNEWCEMIWSLTEFEEGSEEYTFHNMFNTIKEVVLIQEWEPFAKKQMLLYDEIQTDNEKIYRWFDSNYFDYFKHLDTFYFDYIECNYDEFEENKHVCLHFQGFVDIQLFVSCEDYQYLTLFTEKMQELDHVYEYSTLGLPDGTEEEESAYDDFTSEEDKELHMSKQDVIFAKAAEQSIYSLKDTMVHLDDICEWIEDYHFLARRSLNEHIPFCDCKCCLPFKEIYNELDDLVNLYKKRNSLEELTIQYKNLGLNNVKKTDFYIQHFVQFSNISIPTSLTISDSGLILYRQIIWMRETLSFVFKEDKIKNILPLIICFQETTTAIASHLLDIFNHENNTYFIEYPYEKLVLYFKERLPEEVQKYFDICETERENTLTN